MTPLLFTHANGFPPLAYQSFLGYLKQNDNPIRFINLHRKVSSWHTLTQTLISFTEENFSTPIIAIGHSLGGALSLFAATRRPELFRQVIAIDPPLLGPLERRTFGLLRLLGLENIVNPLPAKALRRKHQFSSYDEARKHFQGKVFFKYFHPNCLEDYLRYGLAPSPEGQLELTVSPQVEASIFKSLPCFFLPRLSLAKSFTILYACPQGKPYNRSGVAWMKKTLHPKALVPYDGGHMAPLEKPELMAQSVLSVMESL